MNSFFNDAPALTASKTVLAQPLFRGPLTAVKDLARKAPLFYTHSCIW